MFVFQQILILSLILGNCMVLGGGTEKEFDGT